MSEKKVLKWETHFLIIHKKNNKILKSKIYTDLNNLLIKEDNLIKILIIIEKFYSYGKSKFKVHIHIIIYFLNKWANNKILNIYNNHKHKHLEY